MKTNTTFKATVTLDKTKLAELIVWAVKNNCSGGLTFWAATDDGSGAVEVSITPAEARAAIEATADLPRKGEAKERSMRMAHQQQRRAAKDKRYILNELGRVDIDGSCRALGLSREELTSHRWKAGSTEHRVKCAIIKEVADENPAKWPRPLVRQLSGAINIEESLDSLGLSRATILRRQWKQGSNPHKVKAAIRCGWKAAQKAKREMKSAAAYNDGYSTNGNIMGEAEMKEKGLKDLSQVA
jgi:hypothetical protein